MWSVSTIGGFEQSNALYNKGTTFLFLFIDIIIFIPRPPATVYLPLYRQVLDPPMVSI